MGANAKTGACHIHFHDLEKQRGCDIISDKKAAHDGYEQPVVQALRLTDYPKHLEYQLKIPGNRVKQGNET